MDQRWAEMVAEREWPPTTRWMLLSENGLGSLIAYLVGPEWVRGKPIPADRMVRVTCKRAGVTTSWEEPLSEEDRDEIHYFDVGYLLDADIDVPSPRNTMWELALPGDLTEETLMGAITGALSDVTPIVGQENFSGKPRLHAERVALETVLARYFTPG